MKGAMPDRVTTSPMRPGGAGGRGGSTGREVPCPPRPAPPLPRSAPPRAAPAAPLQHARRMLASCSGRKGPEGRYPLHYLVWHNRARDLDRELSAKQVGRRRGGTAATARFGSGLMQCCRDAAGLLLGAGMRMEMKMMIGMGCLSGLTWLWGCRVSPCTPGQCQLPPGLAQSGGYHPRVPCIHWHTQPQASLPTCTRLPARPLWVPITPNPVPLLGVLVSPAGAQHPAPHPQAAPLSGETQGPDAAGVQNPSPWMPSRFFTG